MSVLFDRKEVIPLTDPISRGPRATFGNIVVSAWREQYETLAVLSLQAEVMERIAKIEEDNDIKLPVFSGMEARRIARFYEDGTSPAKPQSRNPLGRVKKQDGPTTEDKMKTFDEMSPTPLRDIFSAVQQNARERVFDYNEHMSRAGPVTGFLGTLAGGAAGSITIRDPFNLATLPIGGVGKTVFSKVATEMLAQSAIEAGNVIPGGVAEQRRLLSVPMTDSEIAGQIALTGLGGGIFRGLAEAPVAVARAIKRSSQPAVPPNTPPPQTGEQLLGTPAASDRPRRSEAALELANVVQTLERAYERRTIEGLNTPPELQRAVIADFRKRVEALDRAIAEGVFDDADVDFRSVFIEILADDNSAPFRFMDERLGDDELRVAFRDANPELHRYKETVAAQIQRAIDPVRAQSAEAADELKRVADLAQVGARANADIRRGFADDTVVKASAPEVTLTSQRRAGDEFEGKYTELTLSTGEKVEIVRDADGGREWGTTGWHIRDPKRQATYIGETKKQAIATVLERASAAKKDGEVRTRRSDALDEMQRVEEDIAEIVQRSSQRPEAFDKVQELGEILGTVDSEISHMFRQFNADRSTAPRRAKSKFADDSEATVDAAVKAMATPEQDAEYARQLAESAANDEILTIDIGDIRNFPLDEPFIDMDGIETTMRAEILSLGDEVAENQSLLKALTECRI